VLSFFGGLRREEFGELIAIVFRPFEHLSGAAAAREADAAILGRLDSKKLLGFLNTLKDLVDQVPKRALALSPKPQALSPKP
jgi:hypothetical protein